MLRQGTKSTMEYIDYQKNNKLDEELYLLNNIYHDIGVEENFNYKDDILEKYFSISNVDRYEPIKNKVIKTVKIHKDYKKETFNNLVKKGYIVRVDRFNYYMDIKGMHYLEGFPK
jgi:hypothetical protein